jgi:toxin ParE1/3/4
MKSRAGLGEELLSSVDACVESIRRRPERHPPVHEGYRHSLIRRFPYAVFYEPSEATVTVYAVTVKSGGAAIDGDAEVVEGLG